MSDSPLVEARDLTKRYSVRSRTGKATLTAVDTVDLSVAAGEMDERREQAVVVVEQAEAVDQAPLQ